MKIIGIPSSDHVPISGIIIGLDYSDSNLVGIKNEKPLHVSALKSNVNFEIRAKKDYFSGSMNIQKSSITPKGIPEFKDNVGGYLYVDVSDNVVDSTHEAIIKIFYDQKELDNIDECSLKYDAIVILTSSALSANWTLPNFEILLIFTHDEIKAIVITVIKNIPKNMSNIFHLILNCFFI